MTLRDRVLPPDPRGVGDEPDYRFTLANERTFLAWIRTALALAAGGLAAVSLLDRVALGETLGILLLALSFLTAASAYRRWALNERAMRLGETISLNGRKITSVPANHVVPAVGYHLDSGTASLVFSGDTTTNDALWDTVNKIENLRYLIIETAFSNSEKELAIISKHLCPSMLAAELEKLKREAEVFITHLKPGELELTMREIEESVRLHTPKMLLNNQEFEL